MGLARARACMNEHIADTLPHFTPLPSSPVRIVTGTRVSMLSGLCIFTKSLRGVVWASTMDRRASPHLR